MEQCDLCGIIFVSKTLATLHKCVQTQNKPNVKKIKNKELEKLITDLTN
ncbi:MAG: hypothetical protein HeimC3_04980 [Candidatus Heimdallarchaeota archaeon LC_3]|nr:MAG: hypothetical protein HeimC3_04980 [Candidatus Heimdallarchaeota archaeon LC_3]